MKTNVASAAFIMKRILLLLVCLCLGLNVFYFMFYRNSHTVNPASFLGSSGIGTNERYYRNLSSATSFVLPLPATTPVQQRTTGKSSSVPLRAPGDSHLPFKDEIINQMDISAHDKLQNSPAGTGSSNSQKSPLKKILLWNEAYGAKDFGFGLGQEPFLRAGCRIDACMTTGDRMKYPPEEIDALLWHFRSNDRSLPDNRSPNTRYVFWVMESASYLYGDISQWNGVFNWTFTYKLDSDFPNPYSIVYRRRLPESVPNISSIISKKTKFAAWFVSHCDTIGGRRKLVESLKQWINVDIYGECGSLQCDRSHQWDTCYKMLERDYKFYFSFENSLCQDYVTEKFFNILRLNVIPVVYGLGRYHLQAPPHSYINALDFPSPKALADYLIYLSKNDTAYNEFFQWKPYHDQLSEREKVSVPWCQLCERLHKDNSVKIYGDLNRWFVQDSNCKTSSSPDILNFIKGTMIDTSTSNTTKP